jgi:hypothetical protein
MLRHINAVALDLIMHHLGRKIDLARPNKRAVLNVHLLKHTRITQALKKAGVFRMNQSAHMNFAPQAIGERDRDQVLADDLHLYNIPRDHAFTSPRVLLDPGKPGIDRVEPPFDGLKPFGEVFDALLDNANISASCRYGYLKLRNVSCKLLAKLRNVNEGFFKAFLHLALYLAEQMRQAFRFVGHGAIMLPCKSACKFGGSF